jgi:hypothetical protein
VVGPVAVTIMRGKATISSLRGAPTGRRSNPEPAAVTLDCFAEFTIGPDPLARNDVYWQRRRTNKGKRNAEKRCSVTAVPHDTARALQGALASRRSTTAHTLGPRSPQASAPGQVSWDLAGRPILYGSLNRERKTSRSSTGVTRARLSQSSECTSRTGRSAGQMMPEAARVPR